MTIRKALLIGVPIVAIAAIAIVTIQRASAQNVPGWISMDDNWMANREALRAFGERFDTSEPLYDAFKQAAGGGKPLTWQQMAEPPYDWSGLYQRSRGSGFDPDLPRPALTAKLTPAGQAVVTAKAERMARSGGDDYDPLSDCRPPGVPRWFAETYPYEFIVTPSQTWLISEMMNDVRRVYTDGREHTLPEDGYPMWNGDTIGFWAGDVLVAHTTFLMAGQYQRGVQPNYSEQTTVVERWHKDNPKTLQADVWVFDPVNLTEPWYVRQSWTQLTNDDKRLRIRYWDCRENPNNVVIPTEQGGSQFRDFDFVPNDAAVSSDATVKKAAQPARPAQP